MAVSNRDRVGRAFELLAAGLGPYVDRRMRQRSPLKDRWFADWASHANQREASLRDPSALLRAMTECWDTGFKDELTKTDRNLVFELRDTRNRWAHNEHFSHDDAYRALDSIERLLTRVDAAEATEVGNAKSELMRLKYEADARKVTPKGDALVTLPAAGLRPWRELIEPHDDVAGFAWDRDGFAVADSYDETTGRYRGLIVGEHATSITAATLVVRPDVAEAQRAAEASERSTSKVEGRSPTPAAPTAHHPGTPLLPDGGAPRRRTRFYGVVRLNAERLNRDFGKVSQEVITQLAAQIGTNVTVTVEVTATRPDGFEESTMRTVSENAATLHFEPHSFEDE